MIVLRRKEKTMPMIKINDDMLADSVNELLKKHIDEAVSNFWGKSMLDESIQKFFLVDNKMTGVSEKFAARIAHTIDSAVSSAIWEAMREKKYEEILRKHIDAFFAENSLDSYIGNAVCEFIKAKIKGDK